MQKSQDGLLWIEQEGQLFQLGLTAQALEELGTIHYMLLPAVAATITAGEPIFEAEAEKAVAEFNSPLSGKVTAVNLEAENDPERFFAANQASAWLIKLADVRNA